MSYLPVAILMFVGFTVGGVILLLTTLLGKGIQNRSKDTPFECGVPGTSITEHRFSVRFYLVAILFLLFDVEGVFFLPWAIVYKKYLTYGPFILIEMGLFVATLLVGYFYVLKKGALEWE